MGEIGEGPSLSELGVASTSDEAVSSPSQVDVFQSTIKDKLGEGYTVDYVRLHGDDHRDLVDTPEAQKIIADILPILPQTFPDFDETNIATKFAGCNGLDVVKAANGDTVGFHAYKMRELNEEDLQAKVMYTSFAGVIPTYNGRRLTELSRLPVIDQEKPDIIAGSTSVPAIILSNIRIAQDRGYALYPQDPHPPAEVVDLARKVYALTQKAPDPTQEHPITSRLTRVRDNVVRKDGENQMPFFDDVMQLTPNEQVFYMLVKK